MVLETDLAINNFIWHIILSNIKAFGFHIMCSCPNWYNVLILIRTIDNILAVKHTFNKSFKTDLSRERSWHQRFVGRVLEQRNYKFVHYYIKLETKSLYVSKNLIHFIKTWSQQYLLKGKTSNHSNAFWKAALSKFREIYVKVS